MFINKFQWTRKYRMEHCSCYGWIVLLFLCNIGLSLFGPEFKLYTHNMYNVQIENKCILLSLSGISIIIMILYPLQLDTLQHQYHYRLFLLYCVSLLYFVCWKERASVCMVCNVCSLMEVFSSLCNIDSCYIRISTLSIQMLHCDIHSFSQWMGFV